IAAVNEHERSARARRRHEEIERFLGAGAVAQIEPRTERSNRGFRHLRIQREKARMLGKRGAEIVAALDQLGCINGCLAGHPFTHSASGCRAGAARANAGSLLQAPSMRTSVGYGVTSILKRRAFASCGTRHTSASVGVSP